MPCAYRGYIANLGKCARRLTASIYTCKGPQDSLNANWIYADETLKTHRLIFVFSVSYLFLWLRSQILTAKPRSQCQSPLYSINANYRWLVFNLISLFWRFHASWSSDIHYYQRLVYPVDQSTANKTGASAWNDPGKNKKKIYIYQLIKTPNVQKKDTVLQIL